MNPLRGQGASVALGLTALLAGAPAFAGEVSATGGALGLGTAVNGLAGGSCGAGLCQVGGGTAAGRNLFHRFSAFDTRGAITGVNFATGGASNVFVGVTNPLGSFIDKLISFSSPGNLFWLSPGGIAISGAGGFANIQQLNLSTATGWRLGNGVFDAAGTTAGQAALLSGAPLQGAAGPLTDRASLAALGLQNNGDLSLSGGLLTVDQSLLLDAQGGNVLLQAAGIQAPGGTVELQGATVNQGSTPIEVGSAAGAGGRISINGGTVLQTAALSANGTSGGDVTIQASHLLSAARITATGSQGSGGTVRLETARNSVSTVDALIDVGGTAGGGSITAFNGGDLFSSGSYLAQGTAPGAMGGTIGLLAPTITLAAAQLDASGSGGGGQIHVGGGFQGAPLAPDRANARQVVVNASATLKADALQAGDGGQVVIWSDESTRFGGHVSARGGAWGGNGGLLEVSSKGDLTFAGTANASAPAGKAGTLWLDPKNIYIENTTIGGYAYDVQPIALPATDVEGATSLVEQLGSSLSSPILVNVPLGGLATPQGVVYLFDGSTYGLLSALYGTGEVTSQKANYSASSNLLALISPGWADGATANAGAATALRFTTGPGGTTAQLASGTSSGTLGTANSLVGGSTGDFSQSSVRFLNSGNALVFTPRWDNVSAVDAGALTWISSTTGKLSDGASGGAIGPGNSLLNTASAAYLPDPSFSSSSYVTNTAQEFLGGNLLIYSGRWDGGKGALTWINGSSGALADGSSGGAIGATNSLVGSAVGDLAPVYTGGQQYPYDPQQFFAQGGNILDPYYRLPNNVVKESVALLRNPYWDNGAASDAGAISWIDVATGKLGSGASAVGVISAANSLVGSSKDDQVGLNVVDLGGFNTLSGITNQGYFAFINPTWDNGTAADAGAFTWLRASTGLLSTGSPIIGTVDDTNSLVGGSSNDRIGDRYESIRVGSFFGTPFTNLLLTSTSWSNGATPNAGALTWIQGSTGQLSNGLPAIGLIRAANSLVGNTSGDLSGLTIQRLNDSVGFNSQLYSNLLIRTTNWDNGAATDAGALTWLNGGSGKLATGLPSFGRIDATTSLVGSTPGDKVGEMSADLTSFPSVAGKFENVLIRNPLWNGEAGAITWLDGTSGLLSSGTAAVGTISVANSLVGGSAGDKVGSGVTRLQAPNPQPSNFFATSTEWSGGAGAVTWISGATGKLATGADPFGAIGAANSLVGSSAGDGVGSTVTVTQQGNVLLQSPLWNNGAAADAGAATWIKASTGALASGAAAVGAIEAANSLVGSSANDGIGTAITGVGSSFDANGANFVLRSPGWDNGAAEDAGAVTWWNMNTGKLADGTDGFGAISSANSLVGSSSGDRIGADFLTTGSLFSSPGSNLLLLSSSWSDGGAAGAGAVTWIGGANGQLANGTAPAKGVISAANSLVGTNAADGIGSVFDRYFTGSSTDTLLLRSSLWDNVGIADVGAITWINLTTGKLADGASALGAVGSSNSLIGSIAGDRVGLNLDTFSRYAFLGSPNWDNASISDAGAITWIDRQLGRLVNGTTAIGTISATNSLVGSSSGDRLGVFAINDVPVGGCVAGTTCLNQDYVVPFAGGASVLIGSPQWDNGPLADAGAVTAVQLSSGTVLGLGGSLAAGPLSTATSLVGTSSDEKLGLLTRNDQLPDGSRVVETNVGVLGTGSAVLASPRWDSATAGDAGAVALVSSSSGRRGGLDAGTALVGGRTGDFTGFSSRNLGSSALLFTPSWDNGAVVDAGAVTWINGTTGALANGSLGGVIGSTMSLLGSSTGDFTSFNSTSSGSSGFIHLPLFDQAGISDAGALAWINPTTGVLANGTTGGAVQASNALFGGSTGDLSTFQLRSVTGSNLVFTASWDNGSAVDAGALTWVNGTTGALASGATGGVIGPAQSLVGGGTGDFTDYYLRSLSSGADNNTLVITPRWDNGAAVDAGAITWLNSSSGKLSDGSSGGVIGPINSLVGTGAAAEIGDQFSPYRDFGNGGVLIYSANWNGGVGALSWLNGKTGALANGLSGGAISAANSLVGSAVGDLRPLAYCFFCTTAQSYFTYNVNQSGQGLLLRNGYWNNQAGAVTWLNTATGQLGDGNPALGAISSVNSLVGSTPADLLGFTTGNYGSNLVLFTPSWDNGLNANAGAVTWLNIATGKAANGTNLIGPLGAANSLVGSSTSDFYGANTNNYNSNLIVFAGGWDNGAAVDAGAVTWINTATGTLADGSVAIGAVEPTNSLVGGAAGDGIGAVRRDLFSSLASNVALISSGWDSGAAADAGAITWISGSSGLLANGNPALGPISGANSLVGSSSGDRIGANALEVGYYSSQAGTNLLVLSGSWDNGPLVDAGAVTWISGLTGQLLDGNAAIGPVSANFSIVGSSAGDAVGGAYAPIGDLYSSTGLNVLLQSPDWDALTPGGPIVDAGAVTFVSGLNGLMVNEIGKGVLSSKNSLIGNTSGDRIGRSVDVVSDDTFFVNGPGISPVGTPPVLANVGAQRVRIVPEPLYPLAAPGINFTDAGDASVTISPSQIQAIANNGTSLVLQASNDILLRPLSNISINNPLGNGGDLTLQAGRSVTLNSSITTDNGNLTLSANDPGADLSLRDPGDATIVQRSNTSIQAGTGAVTINLAPTASPLQTAGTISLSNIAAGAIEVIAPSISLSRATLTAAGSVEFPLGRTTLTGTDRLSISGSTLTSRSPSGEGGTIALESTALVIGGSTLTAAGTGSGDGGSIRIGAESTSAVPTSVSITSSSLDARGGTSPTPTLSNGGAISIDGGFIALAGATLNTSGLATGGTINIGTSPVSNPGGVSIVNTSLIADPPANGGFISVGGTTLFTSGSLFNVVGTSGGQVLLGNAFTQALIFGSGTSVLGGGSGLFVYQGNLIYNPELAPYTGGTLRIIGTIFSPAGPITPIPPTSSTSPTAGATGLLASPLASTFPLSALTSALLSTNFNLLLVTGVTGSTYLWDGTSLPPEATGLFSSADPSLFAGLPLQLTLDQSSLLYVDGYLDPVLDPSLLGLDALDLQKRAARSPAGGTESETTGSLSVDEQLKLPNLGQGGNPADRGDRDPVSVTDLDPSQAEILFLKGEQAAQTNATTKLGVEPEPNGEAINVLQLQQWLRQVVPYVQQRLQSGR